MVSKWNPFAADSSPFEIHVTEEDQMFGAEFDKIRQEGDSKKIIFFYETNILPYFTSGTRSLEQLENNLTIPEDVFQEAPFSLRQQRALKKNTSVESNVDI